MASEAGNPVVKTDRLTKIYGHGPAAVTALDSVSLRVLVGEFVAVTGPSGCGKSTLLHLIGGLDSPTSGRVLLLGQDLASLDDVRLTELRRRKIGFVFQFFNLIPVLDSVENTALPMILDGTKMAEARSRASQWLERVGLPDRKGHRPDQLSGGEQQRVAIARALAAEPALVLADEPTGNLDTRAGNEIASLLRQVSKQWQRTVLMVTHDPAIAAYADRIVHLKDGKIVGEAGDRT
jgi:putative ABC transport system ATP-binding protein